MMLPWQVRRSEERAIADAQVQAAAAAVTVLERRLDKMVLRAPADGVVSVIAAEIGENVRPGQPILMVEAAAKAMAFIQRSRGPSSRPCGRADRQHWPGWYR